MRALWRITTASTRPGFLGPENLTRTCVGVLLSAGFNEAGVFRPGKRFCATWRGGVSISFNEAGVFRPGKLSWWWLGYSFLESFNEAGVFRPGKPKRPICILAGR